MNTQSPTIQTISSGATQRGLRDYNERLILSMIQRNGALPGSEVARHAGLSPQTVSVIMRKLEADGLLAKGMPLRAGRVGKPSVPMDLAADGAFSFGLDVGRRGANLVLMDFQSTIRARTDVSYAYPRPDEIFDFLKRGIGALSEDLTGDERHRRIGIGIAAPFELWNWHEIVGAPAEDFEQWRAVDFERDVAAFSNLPVHVVNDATAACRAELVFSGGKRYRDFAYFYVGAFLGGGVVINHSVFEGHRGNAGSMGTLPTHDADGQDRVLLDLASIVALEDRISAAGGSVAGLHTDLSDWSAYEPHVSAWIDTVARQLAHGAHAACSVIDFDAVIIDGAMPESVRRQIVERTNEAFAARDTRGLFTPIIAEGNVGPNAQALGAACGPINDAFFLTASSGLVQT